MFLHIVGPELTLHSNTSNSDILIMIATIIILTEQIISSSKNLCILHLQIIFQALFLTTGRVSMSDSRSGFVK